VRVEVPEPTISDGTVGAAALAIDRFGNVTLNVRPPDLERAGLHPGTVLEVVTGGGRVLARRERTFGGLRRGEVVLFDDSSGRAALAVAAGAFVDVCPVGPGDAVLLLAR
jgi:S-adenosylmethionine hydrolase